MRSLVRCASPSRSSARAREGHRNRIGRRLVLAGVLALIVATMLGNGWALVAGDDQRSYLTHRTVHPGMLDLAGLSERTPVPHERRPYLQLGVLAPGSRYVIDEDAAGLIWRGRDRLWLAGLGRAGDVRVVPGEAPADLREPTIVREGNGRWFPWRILLGETPPVEIRVMIDDGTVLFIDSTLVGAGG